MSDQANLSLTIQDASAETSVSSFNLGLQTPATIAANIVKTNALQNAIVGIILGNLFKSKYVYFDNTMNANVPTNQAAQKEMKWMVHYHDNTDTFGALQNPHFGDKYVVSIACPDTSKLVEGTDRADLTETAVATFVTAFEDVALAPGGGAAKIDYIEIV
jgi:hypothetical protein